MPRHRHLAPYAALVLRGGYVEAGDCGRFHAIAGHVLLHDMYESHQDQFGQGGADILNLRLTMPAPGGLGRVSDPDSIVRAAARGNMAEAAALLLKAFVPIPASGEDWPDLLAADLRADRVSSLARWADSIGLAPSSVSRGFRLAYGLSPQRFRLEGRAAEAMRALRGPRSGIAAVAAQTGFADQPHLTRTVSRMFGRPPARLRAHVNCVQDEAAAAR